MEINLIERKCFVIFPQRQCRMVCVCGMVCLCSSVVCDNRPTDVVGAALNTVQSVSFVFFKKIGPQFWGCDRTLRAPPAPGYLC